MIYLEGTDCIGKSVLSNVLNITLGVAAKDRCFEISKNVFLPNKLKKENIQNIKTYIKKHPKDLFVFLVYTQPDTEKDIKKKLSKRKKDFYDKNFYLYNESYRKITEEIESLNNVLILTRDNKTPYELINEIIKFYVKDINYKELPITIEGESKIYRQIKNTNLAFATLKPTVYSHTYKRYGIVPETDTIRNAIWSVLGYQMNREYNAFIFDEKNYLFLELNYLANNLFSQKGDKDIFISNFVTKIDNNTSIVVFEKEIPPIEIVWKRKHVGTPKYKLRDIEKYNTKFGIPIVPDELYPKPIVRFDWRNPIIHHPDGTIEDSGDECIPDDFADFYIDVNNAKNLAKFASLWLFVFFDQIGLELVDLCYFMNYKGTRIHSEISPDGMRLKLKANQGDFDKDLWRKGGDKSLVAQKWREVYEKIKEEL